MLTVQRDAHRTRFRTVRECLGECTPLAQPPPADWPFRGPSATMELMASIRAVSDDTAQFHEHFLRSTGLGGDHPVAHKHREMQRCSVKVVTVVGRLISLLTRLITL